MSGTTMIILFAFVVYLAFMVVIGAMYMKKTSSSEDYFLGGRGLNGWVAAFSAQASDMSGWLLMGLPGAIYAMGTGQIWIAVGLCLGTIFNWLCIPEDFANTRSWQTILRPSRRILRTDSATRNGSCCFFHLCDRDLFLVYTASALAAGGKLLTPYSAWITMCPCLSARQ